MNISSVSSPATIVAVVEPTKSTATAPITASAPDSVARDPNTQPLGDLLGTETGNPVTAERRLGGLVKRAAPIIGSIARVAAPISG